MAIEFPNQATMSAAAFETARAESRPQCGEIIRRQLIHHDQHAELPGRESAEKRFFANASREIATTAMSAAMRRRRGLCMENCIVGVRDLGSGVCAKIIR